MAHGSGACTVKVLNRLQALVHSRSTEYDPAKLFLDFIIPLQLYVFIADDPMVPYLSARLFLQHFVRSYHKSLRHCVECSRKRFVRIYFSNCRPCGSKWTLLLF